MTSQLFYRLSPLWVLCCVSLILFAAAIVGVAIGRRSGDRIDDKSQVSTIQASMLGILGLLLGFTFAIASSRYDTRRVLAIDEANAVGTTFMRAQMLPEPHRSAISRSLKRYVDLRARAAAMRAFDPNKQTTLRTQTEELQQTIWRQASAVGRVYQNDIVASFVESLNQSIDLYASRVATYYARVPNTILWILLCMAVAALGMVGYGFGVVGQRGLLVIALVAVMVAAVMVMIVDLDRPEAGPTRVSQQTMLDLQRSLDGYRTQAGKQ